MNESPIDPDVALRVQGHVDSERLREAIAALAPLPEGVVKSSLANFALAVVDRAS